MIPKDLIGSGLEQSAYFCVHGQAPAMDLRPDESDFDPATAASTEVASPGRPSS
jgi:hypothetical protein